MSTNSRSNNAAGGRMDGYLERNRPARNARGNPALRQSLDPRLLLSLITLADELHFGRAAENLHLSQPALSQQIRRLEQQVGTELFTRDSRGVELTAAGRAVLAPARAAQRAVIVVQRAAWEAGVLGLSRLRVGVAADLDDIASTLLSYEREQDVAISISRMDEPQGEEALQTGQIDAFIGMLMPSGDADLAWVRVGEASVSALLSPNDRLSDVQAMTLPELRRHPIAVLDRDPSRRRFERYIDTVSEGRGCLALRLAGEGGADPRRLTTDLDAIRGGRAIGVGLSPSLTRYSAGLRSVPFVPSLTMPIYLTSYDMQATRIAALVEHLDRATPARLDDRESKSFGALVLLDSSREHQ